MKPLEPVIATGSVRSPEADLLLCCATSAPTPARTARLRAIVARGVDWNRLAHLAQLQSVMPLVYRYLTAALGDEVPAAAHRLRQAFHGNAVRNLHLARELVRLTALLERGGVESIAIKGPALAMAAYGGIAMRQFTDLDVLVREAEVARAVPILLGDGYAPCAGYAVDDLGRPGTYEIALAKPGAMVEIDLHWRLIPSYFPFAIDREALWRRAVCVDLEGAAIRLPAPADHLLYLCAHGAKHGWEALGGICDLAELIRASSIDWDALNAHAAQAGARRTLALGLLLAHEILDAAIPPRIIEAARREPAVIRAARTFIDYVNHPNDDGPGLFQRWSVPLRVIESPAARIRYVAARALTPNADDREFMRLPARLDPLYYLLRPLRVALTEAPAALRRLVRSSPSPSA